MNDIIQINNLKKSFGDIRAVDDVSYKINQGEMFGLVGPDGAGKSTTIKVLCGLLKPTSGDVTILGKDISTNTKEIKNLIGYLSQKFSLYHDLSVDENIEFFAKIHNINNFDERRNKLLDFTRLNTFRNRLADNLSGGMKQKLALACSLIHQPKILFLDEPTTGVDPVSRRDFWKILSDLQKQNITIFMTTPYLDEAERCNRVALMNQGKIICVDTPDNIKSSTGKLKLEIICSPIKLAYQLIKDKLNYEIQIFGDRINIFIEREENDFSEIKSLLEKNSVKIINSRISKPSLENVFMHLIKEAG
ncbi:MAG: ABC transporter ATP-binding protein [Ignavibacteriales bacterium]|nr:ABC transporter ATP-binding protein [Ignavibacteriales bacterium]